MGWEAAATLVPRRLVRASHGPVTGHWSLSPNGAGWALLLAQWLPSVAWGWDHPSHLTPSATGARWEAEASPSTLLKPPNSPKYLKCVYCM